MSDWIVVLERDDEDPHVIVFDSLKAADRWATRVNRYSEKAWPNSFHNYARYPVTAKHPAAELGRIMAEERQD